MTRLALSFLLVVLVLPAATPRAFQDEGTPPAVPGPLVIVGGGGTPGPVLARLLELGGGAERARVLIFPQASSRPEAGLENRAMFAEAGAKEVAVADTETPDAVLTELARADVVWFSGGDQSRLMEALRGDARLIPALHARHREGAVFGGTSAGAAVMSDPMLIGGAVEDAVVAGGTPTAPGLGLLPGTLVDQHFLARRRVFRLISALLDHPERLGLGIDERTAVLARGGRLEVLGEGAVLVLDARKAEIRPAEKGRPRGFTGLVTHHLTPGMTIEL